MAIISAQGCCVTASPLWQVVEKPPFFMKPTDHRKVIHVNFFAASVRMTPQVLAACPLSLRVCFNFNPMYLSGYGTFLGKACQKNTHEHVRMWGTFPGPPLL